MSMSDNSNRSEGKICLVCGDHALSNNFNAVTCESCKAFFRRNALKNKEFRCAFNDKCQISPLTRRFCQCCRLAKCFAVGMKKELIMSDQDKAIKRRKTEQKKRMKIIANELAIATSSVSNNENNYVMVPCNSSFESSSSSAESCSGMETATTTITAKSINTNEIALQTESIEFLLESQTRVLITSSTQTDEPWPVKGKFVKACNCNSNSHCAFSNEISSISFANSDPIHDVFNETNEELIPLDATQTKLLSDLILANKALEAPVDQEISDLPNDEFKNCGSGTLLDVINLTAVAIRRLIKMCKKIPDFRELCQEDQLALLKQGCTQMMLLRSVITFDPDRNSWKIPHTIDQMSTIKVEVLKEARGNLYEAHEAFLKGFDSKMSQDINVITILTSIALFDPDRTCLAQREKIRQKQLCYFELLQNYLESLYRKDEASSFYDHLIEQLKGLYRLNDEHVRVYLDVNPSQVEPLLIEIFDLKTPNDK